MPRARCRRLRRACWEPKARCTSRARRCSPPLPLTPQTLFTNITTRASTQAMADDLFAVVAGGQVKIRIEQRYRLADVQQAHRDLEARKTIGSTIFTL